jgi:hypothetical protein
MIQKGHTTMFEAIQIAHHQETFGLKELSDEELRQRAAVYGIDTNQDRKALISAIMQAATEKYARLLGR